ncbi:cilia- and flagella-associated protein 45 [Alligator mississippiensis]|nr:cilia- and flagella-associated protein 45 [Alligator mississippiensis]
MLQAKQHQETREREEQQSLLEQMACKKHQQVKQTKRHCSYFEQVVRKQQEQALKMRRQQEERVAKQVEYGKAVRRLVLECQDQLVHKWAICFEAGKHQQQDMQKPPDCNGQLKRTRMQELRASVLPDKYCRAVEHKGWMKPGPKD